MDKTALVEQDIREGKEIVEELDKEGLFFPIAMWFLSPRNNEWMLLFGKEDVNKVGAREYYKKIQRALNKLRPKPEITVNDISVIGTDSELAKQMKLTLKTVKGISGIRFPGNVINGRLVPAAYVYRLV